MAKKEYAGDSTVPLDMTINEHTTLNDVSTTEELCSMYPNYVSFEEIMAKVGKMVGKYTIFCPYLTEFITACF